MSKPINASSKSVEAVFVLPGAMLAAALGLDDKANLHSLPETVVMRAKCAGFAFRG